MTYLHVPMSFTETPGNRLQDKLPKAIHKSITFPYLLTSRVNLHKEEHKKGLYVDIQPLYLLFIGILLGYFL